ncbi:DUF58 domain-containing protein [Nocardia camponoti]|uniref:Lipoprotein n=1 Tax=Nocardia camponoti TaxID=1616106 RepID=A0A917QL03_9NOCA|nr:DUF58 domain-containing protein [Nocardia camponoti]GGK54968.1 lipoprotein [Nocardia camponoti]
MVVTGRFALLALASAALVMFVLPSLFGVALACVVLAGFALVDIALTPRAGALPLSRTPLTVVRLGNSTDVELTVTNPTSAKIQGRLWDNWSETARAEGVAHDIVLPGNTRTRLSTTLRPAYRGDRVAGPVTLRLTGPMGFAGRQYQYDVPSRIRTLPAFASERLLRSKVKRLHHLDGRNVANTRGQGSEFDSFREYVAGDDVRAIDWRATARANDVLVRTWRPERNRHVLMVLDTSRAAAGRIGDGTRLDCSIEAALLLGGLAAAAGDTVDMLAFDEEVRAEVSGVSGTRLVGKLMHSLAPLVPRLVDSDTNALVRTIISRLRRRALIVWFTSLDPATVNEHLLPALPTLAKRHRVLIVSVADPDIAAAARDRTSADAIYQAAAAESVLSDRAMAAESLRRMGIAVITAAPEHLPEAIADEYLELKSAGSQ